MILDAIVKNELLQRNRLEVNNKKDKKSQEQRKFINTLKRYLFNKYFTDAEEVSTKTFKNGCYIVYKRLEIKVKNLVFEYDFSVKYKNEYSESIGRDFINCLKVSKPTLKIIQY